ncbi:TolC family protein [Hankyongella ginsenosidimutans]|uniref:TolC family protein n=1 Tax=Hankyongella ginsenosidimutans TaxID=1763828 RepID=A0A4D7BZC5_9SPHN|nr:TolC family protein [Hankyongella ginsenosidimutans]QCI78824.1 TolC family protein [Hankyongella ginsenosidimutans]
MNRLIAAALAAASCASIAQAQTAPTAVVAPPLTLEDALALARAASPSNDAGDAGVRSADAARRVAGLRPNPELQVQSENVAGSGAYRGLSSAETTVGLALPIELGGKRSARIGVADARGARARIAAAILRADLELTVTQAYAEAIAAERRLDIARTQVGIATEGLRVATDRVQVGATSPIDQQRAEVAAVNARAALEKAERAVLVARANLGRLLGRSVAEPLDMAWFDRAGGIGPVITVDPDGTLALAAARADLATANAQVRLARAQRIPDLTVSAGARRLEATNDVAAVVGVSIPIPLFNTGKAALDQARADRDQADALTRLARLDAARAIASAQADVANAATAARAAGGPVLAAAQEAARIARIGYGQGKFGQLELLDAERTLAETRAAWVDALAAYHDAVARLRRLTQPVPTDIQIPETIDDHER